MVGEIGPKGYKGDKGMQVRQAHLDTISLKSFLFCEFKKCIHLVSAWIIPLMSYNFLQQGPGGIPGKPGSHGPPGEQVGCFFFYVG